MVVATGWFGFRRESDTRRLRGGGFGYCFVLVVCVLTPACGRVGFEALASYDEADDANPSPEGPNAAPSPANESTPPAPPTSGNDDADAGADSSEGNGGASGSGSGGTSVAGSTASAGGSSGAARGGSGGTGLAGASAAGAVSSTDGGAGAGSSGGGSSAAGASSAGGGSGAGGASSAGGGSGASSAGGGSGAGGASSASGGGGASSASGGGGASAGSGSTDPCAPTNGGVEICDGLDNDCNGGVDENGCPSTCSGVAYAGDGYMVCDSMIPWDEAVATCATENMLLATAKTAEKNQVLVDLMYPADGSQDLSFGWLGLSRADSSSPFYWTDGTVLEGYANWEGGNPSGAGVANCVQMNSAGEWFASRCDFVKRFVCEPA